jgi:multidrug efflux pump subunit AcrB
MKAPIKWMAGNHVAANLLMMLFIVGGLVMGFNIKQEVFPEIEFDSISISVPYPGAGPEEVEEGILLKVEDRLSSITGIKEIKSGASEGLGTVILELLSGEDIDSVLQDVKTEIDRIDTFPEDAEEPVITKIVFRGQVISVVVYGDLPERSLRERAEEIRDDLLAMPGITQAELSGVRPYEISIEVPEETLRSFGLTLEQIANRVRQASLDLPAGSVETEGGEVLIRTKEKRYRGIEYEEIPIIESPDGTEVRLGDIANVKDSFEDTDTYAYFDGKPAAMVSVFRVGEQKPIDISKIVKGYVAEKGETLPESVKIATWNDESEILRARENLLLKNAFLGLILVFFILGLFLQIRLALWVMLGLPISFLGAMLFMPVLDVSINMISLFSFILVLGIVVDDAIIVGENIFEHRKRGKRFMQAAVDGVLEVSGPVVFSILSTVAAFLPLLFISGTMGKFIGVIPLIVIPVLAVSLIECLFVLPAHLSGGKPSGAASGMKGFFRKIREGFSERLDRFISGPYSRLLSNCLRHRFLTVATAIAVLLVSVGIVGGGIIKFVFMPEVDSDAIVVTLKMPVGTTADKTAIASDHLVDKALQTAREFEPENGGAPVLRNVYSLVGGTVLGGHSLEGPTSGGNLSGIVMYLTPGEDRSMSSSVISARWRELVGEIPGAESVTFKSSTVDFGANINVRLAHKDVGVLEKAAERLKDDLAKYPGVVDIVDSYSQGKKELKLRLRPEARTLGITEADLAGQVRGAFYGVEALRLQRGRNEVKVMVRYPEDDRKSLSDIETMYVRSQDGVEVPFRSAAYVEEGKGFNLINRTDRKRVVNVTANVEARVANADEILTDLKATALQSLVHDYAGLSYDLEGEEKERKESMQSMGRGYIFALFLIFAMLAIPFKSYSQPLIIMAAIPFGIVGGVAGHLIMGYNLSILSVFGIVALSGVVVNDSLLLIDFINRRRRKGMGLQEAVMNAGRRRFRPILLTSMTTFFGLSPMMLETSMQARFLIPMAISLAFGILFATGITLLLIPTLYMTLESVKEKWGIGPAKLSDLEENNGENDVSVQSTA